MAKEFNTAVEAAFQQINNAHQIARAHKNIKGSTYQVPFLTTRDGELVQGYLQFPLEDLYAAIKKDSVPSSDEAIDFYAWSCAEAMKRGIHTKLTKSLNTTSNIRVVEEFNSSVRNRVIAAILAGDEYKQLNAISSRATFDKICKQLNLTGDLGNVPTNGDGKFLGFNWTLTNQAMDGIEDCVFIYDKDAVLIGLGEVDLTAYPAKDDCYGFAKSVCTGITDQDRVYKVIIQ